MIFFKCPDTTNFCLTKHKNTFNDINSSLCKIRSSRGQNLSAIFSYQATFDTRKRGCVIWLILVHKRTNYFYNTLWTVTNQLSYVDCLLGISELLQMNGVNKNYIFIYWHPFPNIQVIYILFALIRPYGPSQYNARIVNRIIQTQICNLVRTV